MKMVGLIDHNPDLLGLIVRMELPLGFGEQTVAEVCRRARVDVTTFLLMCQVYTLPRFVPSRSELRVVRPEDLLRYLRSSHRYYVGTSLVSMSHALEELLAPAPQAKQKVIRRFYEDYRTDLEKHFEFEENVVFPYVDALVRGEFADGEGYGLDEEDHTHIGEKIEDLKNIVLKYLPEECDPAAASAFVARIYTLAADLHRHSAIEEKLLEPHEEHALAVVPRHDVPANDHDLAERVGYASQRLTHPLISFGSVCVPGDLDIQALTR